MDRYIRKNKDGDFEVAVILENTWGIGFTTFYPKISPFEPKIVELIEKRANILITPKWILENLGIAIDGVTISTSDLKIEWVRYGTKFTIEEYDGLERIITEKDLQYTA